MTLWPRGTIAFPGLSVQSPPLRYSRRGLLFADAKAGDHGMTTGAASDPADPGFFRAAENSPRPPGPTPRH